MSNYANLLPTPKHTHKLYCLRVHLYYGVLCLRVNYCGPGTLQRPRLSSKEFMYKKCWVFCLISTHAYHHVGTIHHLCVVYLLLDTYKYSFLGGKEFCLSRHCRGLWCVISSTNEWINVMPNLKVMMGGFMGMSAYVQVFIQPLAEPLMLMIANMPICTVKAHFYALESFKHTNVATCWK